MNRRGFLGAILAAGAAPAVVKYANLMPVFRRAESGLIVPQYEAIHSTRDMYDVLSEICPSETALSRMVISGDWKMEVQWLKALELKYLERGLT